MTTYQHHQIHSGFQGLPPLATNAPNGLVHHAPTALIPSHMQQLQQDSTSQQSEPAVTRGKPATTGEDRGKGGLARELAKLREQYLRQQFALLISQRQLQVTSSRLRSAMEGLKLAKENKPFHKYFSLAMDEKRHHKELPKLPSDSVSLFENPLDDKSDGDVPTKTVATKKGERERPAKYSTRSKDEMIVIAAAANYVVSGTSSLREAKDALRIMGIRNFETSLSNKMYNHPDKKEYLRMRKEKREEKKLESEKKTEARTMRKRNRDRETEAKETRKRQKNSKQKLSQVPILHEVHNPPHLPAYPPQHYAHQAVHHNQHHHPHHQHPHHQHLFGQHDMAFLK